MSAEDDMSPEANLFFRTIKELNEQHHQGESIVVQITATKAMVIYWKSSHWEYDIYRFKKDLIKEGKV